MKQKIIVISPNDNSDEITDIIQQELDSGWVVRFMCPQSVHSYTPNGRTTSEETFGRILIVLEKI